MTEKGWLPRAKWALHEANRLGLDGFVMIGAAGCGHAQTDPRHAQKDLVFTEARMERCNGRGARCPSVVLPKKGVKETPKNADGAPLRIRISLALGMSHLIRRGVGRRSR